MKKIILFVVITTIFSIPVFCQSNPPQLVQKTSMKQVKSIAKQFNLQESVSLDKTGFLIYLTKEEVEKWCQEQKSMIDYRKTRVSFFKDTKSVRNRSDYFKLLNSYPAMKQRIIDAHGGEAAFQKFKDASLKRPWRIYRNPKGELTFVNGQSPISEEELLRKQQRIDNLPKE